jgi:hypothetical protein
VLDRPSRKRKEKIIFSPDDAAAKPQLDTAKPPPPSPELAGVQAAARDGKRQKNRDSGPPVAAARAQLRKKARPKRGAACGVIGGGKRRK